MKEWLCIGGGAQDALDDVQLFDGISSFLYSITDHRIVESPNFQDPSVCQAWSNLEQAKSSLIISFTSQTKMPKWTSSKISPPSSTARKLIPDVCDIDSIGPEDLVEHIDAMACAAFSNVNEEVESQ